jgi:ATP-binding cassette subfamily B protein
MAENKLTRKEHISLFKRSWRLLWQLDRVYTMTQTAAAALRGIIPYISVYMSALILDELIDAKRIDRLVLYAALTVGLTFLLQTVRSALEKVQEYHLRILYQNEERIFSDKLMSMDYAQIESAKLSALYHRIRMESQTGYNLYYLRTGADKLVSNLISAAAALGITLSLFGMGAIPLWMKLMMVGALTLLVLLNQYMLGREQKLQMRFFEDCVDSNRMFNYLDEHFANYHTGMETRLYGMEELAMHTCESYEHQVNEENFRMRKKTLPYRVGSELIMSLFLQLLAYSVVIYGAAAGGISVGSVAKYASSMTLLVWSIQNLVGALHQMANNHQYLKRYFAYMDIPSQMQRGTLPVEKRILCEGGDKEYEIEFRSVSFRYPETEAYALQNVSLKFKIGGRLAVVGRNGSGKTTFIKLLCRLYDPTEGQILLNGIDIRKYDYEEYLSIFSIVFQDFKLFPMSLGQNIAADTAYDCGKVRDCIQKVGLQERFEKMPQGLETCLYKDFDESGVEISGGEAQKIALARALHRNAPFIILDEPTAALDPIAEAEIYEKFNQIVQDRTAVYISHRLSSCRFCDEIVVFDGGRLVQQGSHEALLKQADGPYYALWQAQAQYYSSKSSAEGNTMTPASASCR